jgi:thiamine biosynthesis lipoprotein
MLPNATSYALLAVVLAGPPDTKLARFEFRQPHMGVEFKLVFFAIDQATADRAQAAAFKRIAQLNGVLSDYNPESELSKLSRSAPSPAPVKLSDDLWQVLSQAQALAAESDGAFDVTVGPLTALWRRARRTRQLPSPEKLAAARAAVGHEHLLLDPQKQTARLAKPGMRLDLGGIGVGYAVDQALAVLGEHGIDRAMIDASGDIGVSGPPPGAKGWRIGVAPLDPQAAPSHYLLLANAAVTTSGDAFQFVEIAGKRYSHIVDPKTGLGLTERTSATVVAPTCTAADSLATAVCVLGTPAGLKLIESREGAAAIIVRPVDQSSQVSKSSRLGQYLDSRSD